MLFLNSIAVSFVLIIMGILQWFLSISEASLGKTESQMLRIRYKYLKATVLEFFFKARKRKILSSDSDSTYFATLGSSSRRQIASRSATVSFLRNVISSNELVTSRVV